MVVVGDCRERKPLAEQSITYTGGRIKEEWKALFEEFPDRFLFGLDLGAPKRASLINELVEYYRSLLGQLSPSLAEKIAYRNAMKLMGKNGKD